jgi:hypothetical protein
LGLRERSLTEVRLCFALRDLCSTCSADRELTSVWEYMWFPEIVSTLVGSVDFF